MAACACQNVFTLCVSVVMVLLLAVCVQAKTREYRGVSRGLFGTGEVGRLSVSEIEARFRPFLEERVRERRGGVSSARAARPSESDFFLLMKTWDSLSAEFRALYSEAMAKPSDYDYSFISPMGKFQIYYMKSGKNRIDTTDNIGYGVKGQPSAWRVRNPSPNGVPDYIDEAALALDSAWSMEIDRFKFPNPIAAASPDYYPVFINRMYDYGGTVPGEKISGASVGFLSYIEINSDWSDWSDLGYDKRPYDALRVTCAHEFFHAIQYAMFWNKNLDDFPLGWLEGSAVLMEEIAYPEINDYFQYISDFFTDDPRISLLTDDYEYLNSILFKYLYEKTNPRDSIGFIKAVHTNKYTNRTLRFSDNIERVSASHAGKSWAEVLNGFHAESYFTGKRARPWAFVTDADSMDSWAIPAASIIDVEYKNVKPYSVEFFRYTPRDSSSDTLTLNISGQVDNSVSGKTWGASVLVMENNDSVGIITVQMNKNGTGRLELAGWKEKSGCLLVVTNSSYNTVGKITVTPYGDGFVNPEQEAAVTVSHNVVKLRTSTNPVSISGGNITGVKIYSPDGKLVWSGKKTANGAVEWRPDKRLTPGAYFMTATSSNSLSGKKRTYKQKIMILP